MARRCRASFQQHRVNYMSYSDYWRRNFLAQHPEYEQQSQALRHEPVEPSPSVLNVRPPWPAMANTVPASDSNLTFPSLGTITPNFEVSEFGPQKRPKTCHGVTPDSSLIWNACRLRQRLKLTQQELAAHLGISVRTLQDWEQGRRQPTGPGKALLQLWIDRHPPEPPQRSGGE